MTKTTHCHWENRFVLQWYGAVRKFYRLVLHVSDTVGKQRHCKSDLSNSRTGLDDQQLQNIGSLSST